MEDFNDLMPPRQPPILSRANGYRGALAHLPVPPATPLPNNIANQLEQSYEPEAEPESGMFGGRRHRRTRRHRGGRRSIKRRAIARTRSKSKSMSMQGGKRRRRHTRK